MYFELCLCKEQRKDAKTWFEDGCKRKKNKKEDRKEERSRWKKRLEMKE